MTSWRKDKEGSRSVSRAELFAVAAGCLLLTTLVLRYLLIERTNVNWDEFNFLRLVHLQAAGEQARVAQTAHSHLFSWVLWFPGHEVDHVLVARHFMFLLSAASAALLGWLGWRLVGGGAGLFAAFVCGAFSFVLEHGTSFRYDPLVLTCFLGAACALVARRRPDATAALAGGLLAAGLVISIKTMFFVPPLLALAALPLLVASERRRARRRLVIFLATCAVLTAALFGLHSLTVPPGAAATQTFVADAAGKAVDLGSLVPQRPHLEQTLRADAPMWILLAIGLGLVAWDLVRTRSREELVPRLQVVALALPVLTLVFYRNSYPYYYPTILPGACLLAGAVWRRLEQMRSHRVVGGVVAAVLGLLVAGTALRWYTLHSEDEVAVQRDVIAAVHEVFPEPVPYIDRCGMVASFRKVGPFISTWVMHGYQKRGVEIIPELLRQGRPAFVLANSPALELWRPLRAVPFGYRWLPGDYRALRAHFIPHWGPILVAGKALRVNGGEWAPFEILIDGTYTVESMGPIDLDGVVRQPRELVVLSRGPHRLRHDRGQQEPVVLRWGAHLPRPERRPPRAPLFRGFALERD